VRLEGLGKLRNPVTSGIAGSIPDLRYELAKHWGRVFESHLRHGHVCVCLFCVCVFI
jgi:hypothetical protein